MKQTAVEWLQEQIETKFDIIGDTNNIESMFIDAKEMEKEQIVEAHLDGQSIDEKQRYGVSDAKQYYSETFKK